VERALARHDARTRLLRLNVEAERQRLVNLLEEWLEFESGRRDFLVEQREREVAATVHGHPVSMRVDRIDRLADGSLMIIDYKSGKPAVGGWAKERIAQPQLPVYATLLRRVHGDTVSAVAVASVRSGDCAMQGIAAAPDLAWGSMQAFGARKGTFSSRFDDWGALLAFWEQGVDALGLELVNGVAGNVVYDEDALRFWDLAPVLRHREGDAWLVENGRLVASTEE
jgi:exodeoxyribonuclease-5